MLTLEEFNLHKTDSIIVDALAIGDDIAVAKRLSELITQVNTVPISVVSAWAAQTGLRARLQDHADLAGSPLRSISLSALDLLQGNMAESFDCIMYAPLLDAMEAVPSVDDINVPVLSSSDRAMLLAAATSPKHVSAYDVAVLVRNTDGSAK